MYFSQMNVNSNSNYHVAQPQNVTKKRIIQIIVDLTCIVLIFLAYILVHALAKPRELGFFCNDTDIFKPLGDELLPFWVVAIYGTIAPILFIVLAEVITSRMFSSKARRENLFQTESKRKVFLIATIHGIVLFVLGMGITLLLTEVAKKWVGRLRPNFMAICNPDMTQINCTTNYSQNSFFYNYIPTKGSFCRGFMNVVEKARESFPSGHASFSTYTMLFLIIYLEARLHLLRLRFIKPLIQTLAFIVGLLTSTSRISDHRHRASDIIGGSLLGACVALFVTLIVGRVIWVYGSKPKYHDFDLRPME